MLGCASNRKKMTAMGIVWLLLAISNGRVTSASKNFMLYVLPPGTNSNIASPSTRVAPPLANASFTCFFDLVLSTPLLQRGHKLLASPESTAIPTTYLRQLHNVSSLTLPRVSRLRWFSNVSRSARGLPKLLSLAACRLRHLFNASHCPDPLTASARFFSSSTTVTLHD